MDIAAFDFHLPSELIAQEPLPQRDQSRMLILERATGQWRDGHFWQFPTEVEPGTVVVINNTRVFPARLRGRRAGHQGTVEILLLRPTGPAQWEALVRPGRVCRQGVHLEFADGALTACVVGYRTEGRRIIQFDCPADQLDALIDRYGLPPLPPYIRRPAGASSPDDYERYQTIYARHRGAVAAPTAGLHFTEQTFAALAQRGIQVVELTHHVGYATFQPVRVEKVEQHHLDAEEYIISEEAADQINRARRERRTILAVGTTSVRALESAADPSGMVTAGPGRTSLFIYPGYRFRVVDALLTNFHLPRSTLLMLVCAFASHALVMRAYQHAVEHRYRFYSYGDCMLIK
ncbi:MAG: tRNA preQ1(34) S-adenosylmethionine ribosyltransferase-isomerase QueA [Acidobacteriota bacterium]|nr:tRNA preQ1(34) S-adenosylmethionine ribosyltransferase-isomerase QueA [Blastocatellia bacterium]MDW8240209.1 tRNA preQ1(34) S-adenosylmethionine ribosyltransferase-isomerase QueA [Acidobacteriota bacterium]